MFKKEIIYFLKTTFSLNNFSRNYRVLKILEMQTIKETEEWRIIDIPKRGDAMIINA